jgi:aminopeptidase 2
LTTLLHVTDICVVALGNLVTPSWWDGLFVKEGFASWLGQLECASDLFPERKLKQAYVSDEMMLALAVDATRNTHPILDENAQTLSQLQGTWDDICYSKGSAVAAMIAAHVGRADFIRGIRKFLHEPHSVSGRDELWKALASDTVDVETFANTWISTPGFPVVTVKEIPGGFALRQERFLQSGDLLPEEDTLLW